MANKGILIGIAGGSGSGKTLVAQRIIEEIASRDVFLIEQDAYYKDLSHLSPQERAARNFDHPDAIDGDLFIQQVKDLIAGKAIEQPIYDFTTHTRKKSTRSIGQHHIIVLEGILILYSQRLRELMDIKIFVDTDPDIRLLRRIRRDVAERGRTIESVLVQYEESVRPMHLQFVEPSKRNADIIIPEGGHNKVAIDLMKTKIEDLLRKRGVV
ncbi:MAG: uridine kinase [bacterium]